MNLNHSEQELFHPIKQYFLDLGYVVKGEIKGIDIMMQYNNQIIGIELKNTVSLKLMYQAIDRQKVCDRVYVGIPVEAVKSHKKQMKSFIGLCKRLNIGILQVGNNQVTCLLEVDENIKKVNKNYHKAKRIRKEFNERKNDLNLGGTKGRIFTRYKEKMVLIANLMALEGLYSIKDLKDKTGIYDVSNILNKNYYHWFERFERGKYRLTEIGNKERTELNQKINESMSDEHEKKL